MAEIILSAYLPLLLDKLSPLILKGLGFMWGVKVQMVKLKRTLLTIQGVLKDAEENQGWDERARIWLGELKTAAYEADDLLDELATEDQEQKMNAHDSIVDMVRIRKLDLLSMSFARRLKKIRNEFDEIAKNKVDYGLTEGVAHSHHVASQRKPTDSLVDASKIYGRDEDKEKIVDLLIPTAVQEISSIIPIVGMGGLGKTTLAKLAFHDQRVVGHFELRMWIHVSDQFDFDRITREILEYATEPKSEISNTNLLLTRLNNNLHHKKFLLVLDDVWTEDHGESDSLKRLLTFGAEGSKIIVTTRSKKVASNLSGIDPYHLKGLSDDHCSTIFGQWAIGVGTSANSPAFRTNLERHGRDMGKKCKGVPLAAKTFGDKLQMQSDGNEWLRIKKSEIWEIPTVTKEILGSLLLSYNNLLLQWKQCFVYCSLFDKGYRFEKDDLVQQWIAQGFIKSEVSKQMEDTGSEYFNNLVLRSLLEVVEKDDDGNAIMCKMHDLISDLVRSVGPDDFFYLAADRVSVMPTTTRYLSLDLRAASQIPGALFQESKSRTLLFLNSSKNIKKVPENVFTSLRRLRVLDLSCTGIKGLPSSICKLRHLRYLNLSKTDVEKLPESISSLFNLQTLKLSGCSLLKELPSNLSKMINLRHLYIDGCNLFTHIPPKIRQLSCLQTLPIFVVCEKSRWSSLEELRSLKLRGELSIKKLINVTNAEDAEKANLKEKPQLRKLGLSWAVDDKANSTSVEEVMEGLQPHENLKSLHIEDYWGMKFSRWMMDSLLKNLVEISLINCKNCKDLPPFEQLSSLKNLTIKTCPELISLPCCTSLKKLVLLNSGSCITSVTNFTSLSYLEVNDANSNLADLPIGDLPQLHTLIVQDFPKLINVPVHLENLTTLKVLQIKYCSELLSIPNLNHLEELYMSGCDDLIENFATGGLTSLKNLTIAFCPIIESLPNGIRHLTALKRLEIHACVNLKSLPEELQQVTTLQSLSISDSYNLASLPDWLGNLTSLRYLMINRCPKITSLPMGLTCLTTLKLSIEDCPHLMS